MKPTLYRCMKCNRWHRFTSRIGIAHKRHNIGIMKSTGRRW